jgi:endothelin-converting enzyme
VVIIQASPAGYNLPSPEYYQENDTVTQYGTMLGKVFDYLLPTAVSRKSATKLAQSVVELEKKIAALTPPPEDRQDITVSESSTRAFYRRWYSTNDNRNPIISLRLMM